MSVGRRIAWAVAALLGPLLAAAVAAPYLVNVEAYKPALIQAVKEATGRELVIDGPMRLRMFPVPRVSAQRVHFANAPGAEGAQMVDVRWIGASPSWWALLRGNVEIGQSHPLPADHRARDRRRRRAQLAVQAGRRRQPGRGRAGRRLPPGDRRAQDRAGHAELHQSADAPDHQGRAGRGDGPGPVPGGTAHHFRQGHGERRAAVARRRHERAQGGWPRPRLCLAGAERQARLQGAHQRSQCQRRTERPSRRDDRRADRLHRRDGAGRRPGEPDVRRLGGRALHLRRRHRAHADAACRHRLQDDDGRRDGVGHAGLRAERHAVAEGPGRIAQDRSGEVAGAAGQPRGVPAGPACRQGAGAA